MQCSQSPGQAFAGTWAPGHDQDEHDDDHYDDDDEEEDDDGVDRTDTSGGDEDAHCSG